MRLGTTDIEGLNFRMWQMDFQTLLSETSAVHHNIPSCPVRSCLLISEHVGPWPQLQFQPWVFRCAVFVVHPGMWTLAIFQTLSLPCCLSIFYFLMWSLCSKPGTERNIIHFSGGVRLVNTGFCSIFRPGSWHICSVSSYLPIYIGKSLRLEWDFMALWFLNPDPVL